MCWGTLHIAGSFVCDVVWWFGGCLGVVQSAVQLLLGSLGVGLLAVVCYVSMSLRLAIVCLVGGVSGGEISVRGDEWGVWGV